MPSWMIGRQYYTQISPVRKVTLPQWGCRSTEMYLAPLHAERIDPLPPLPPPTDQPRMFQTPPSPEGGRPRVKKEGRTFDDIREENRKQQTQQAYPLRAQWMEKQQQQQQREEKDAIGIDQRPQGMVVIYPHPTLL